MYEQQNGHVEEAIEQFKKVLQLGDVLSEIGIIPRLNKPICRKAIQVWLEMLITRLYKSIPETQRPWLDSGYSHFRESRIGSSRIFSRLPGATIRCWVAIPGRSFEEDRSNGGIASRRAKRASPDLARAQAAADQLLQAKTLYPIETFSDSH